VFGTVVEKVQALLSRAFLLGSFFPVLVFATLNFALAWIGIDAFGEFLTARWSSDAVASSTTYAVLLVALAIVSFILAPLIPVFRTILEGAGLPKQVREMRIGTYAQESRALQDQLQTAKTRFNDFGQLRRNAEGRFGSARNDAHATRTTTSTIPIDNAQGALDQLADQLASRATNQSFDARLPDFPGAENAVATLEAALGQYPMQPPPANPDPDRYRRLDRLQSRLLSNLDQARDTAYRALQSADSECRQRFVADDIRPTRIANSRAAMERYPSVAYSADFDFLWPRLRMVLPKDQIISSAVDLASAQLDFAVLMTVLSAVTTLFWTVVLAFYGTSILLFVTVGIMMPALVIFFYMLIDATQKAFGEVMVMAIDGLRLELLRALHHPLPTSLTDEQKIWQRLQLALYSGLGDQVRYRHPKT
jgi:hypothetical protein